MYSSSLPLAKDACIVKIKRAKGHEGQNNLYVWQMIVSGISISHIIWPKASRLKGAKSRYRLPGVLGSFLHDNAPGVFFCFVFFMKAAPYKDSGSRGKFPRTERLDRQLAERHFTWSVAGFAPSLVYLSTHPAQTGLVQVALFVLIIKRRPRPRDKLPCHRERRASSASAAAAAAMTPCFPRPPTERPTGVRVVPWV